MSLQIKRDILIKNNRLKCLIFSPSSRPVSQIIEVLIRWNSTTSIFTNLLLYFYENKQKQPPEVIYKKRVLKNLNSVEKMFLKISQNLQESTCARVSFFNFIKKEALAQVFSCEFCEIFKNIISADHIRATASEEVENAFKEKSMEKLPYIQIQSGPQRKSKGITTSENYKVFCKHDG